MTDQTPMPTMLGDPLPGFVPALWIQACTETQWATQQLQGFCYRTGPVSFAMVVRDVGRPPEQQVMASFPFEVDREGQVSDSGYPAGDVPAYNEAHERMRLFVAEQQLLTIAERYRVLRRSYVAKGAI